MNRYIVIYDGGRVEIEADFFNIYDNESTVSFSVNTDYEPEMLAVFKSPDMVAKIPNDKLEIESKKQ